MFSHIMLGANDLEASKQFYDAVLGKLGAKAGVLSPNLQGHKRYFYFLEGSIFIAGASIQWLRDKLKIIKNSKSVLKNSIQKGGSSIRNFVNTSGNVGNFQNYFKVYKRQGRKCPKNNCDGKILRTVISNRSTFYCNICQKLKK